jgi:hypothetical protein
MNIDSDLIFTWRDGLPQDQIDHLDDYANTLQYVSDNTTIASGRYSYYAVKDIQNFIAKHPLLCDYLLNIKVNKAGSVDRYLARIDGLDTDPGALVTAAWASQSHSPRSQIDWNKKPYWDDFFNFDTGSAVKNAEVYQTIQIFKDTNPAAYATMMNVIHSNMNKFGVFKDDRDFIKIVLHEFTVEYYEQLKSMLPAFLKDLPSRISLQVMRGGTFSQIHSDNRCVSLFWLLTPPTVETQYYMLNPKYKGLSVGGNQTSEKTKSSGHIYAPEHVFYQSASIIQPNRWYLFNHEELHSVVSMHPTENDLRLVYTVDFEFDIDYYQLANILYENKCNLFSSN